MCSGSSVSSTISKPIMNKCSSEQENLVFPDAFFFFFTDAELFSFRKHLQQQLISSDVMDNIRMDEEARQCSRRVRPITVSCILVKVSFGDSGETFGLIGPQWSQSAVGALWWFIV